MVRKSLLFHYSFGLRGYSKYYSYLYIKYTDFCAFFCIC